MTIRVKLIKDSIYSNHRLTTLELEYPRYIHSELMTHRVFSRNAQSSRAIPIKTVIERIQADDWYPIFMKNKSGMSADERLSGADLIKAKHKWQMAKLEAINYANKLSELGVHKQVANRLLEPFSTITVIVSATEWDNFFNLRIHKDAQQEFQELAMAIRATINSSEPTKMDVGNWHLPYIRENEEGLSTRLLKMISVARCARVSYLSEGRFNDYEKDIILHNKLMKNGHLSPFEHVATPSPGAPTSNFVGWNQYRKEAEDARLWLTGTPE